MEKVGEEGRRSYVRTIRYGATRRMKKSNRIEQMTVIDIIENVGKQGLYNFRQRDFLQLQMKPWGLRFCFLAADDATGLMNPISGHTFGSLLNLGCVRANGLAAKSMHRHTLAPDWGPVPHGVVFDFLLWLSQRCFSYECSSV